MKKSLFISILFLLVLLPAPISFVHSQPITEYKLLAPLPCKEGTEACPTDELKNFDVKSENSLGRYLNVMIRIFIGICAVLAMVMIIMGGLEYMTSELVSSKESGKHKITGALLGLILALGSYAILNTINPDLLKSDFSEATLPSANKPIEVFEVKGPLSRTETPVNVNFNTEAYPAAKTAGDQTGVDPALVLAIFAQETGAGANVGACSPDDPNAKMPETQKTALRQIVGSNYANTRVSCAGTSGTGGAIGLTQFLPDTWLRYRSEAAGLLGHQPDPWNTNDALMMTAIYLRSKGGASDPHRAACAYFAGTCTGPSTYADQVVARMEAIKKQIEDGRKNGTLRP